MNFWWALSLFLIVPVIVHLFSFRRVRKFYFSSIKYITNSTAKSKSKSRIKHRIILANRFLLFSSILFLLYLISTQKSIFKDESFTIYFDNSISSQVTGGIDIAKQMLTDLKERHPEDGIYFDNNRKIFLDKDFRIERLGNDYSNFALSLQDVNEKLRSTQIDNHYILSDFQSIKLESVNALIQDTSSVYHLLYLEELNRFSNISIDTLIVSPNSDDLSKLSITVRFNAFNIKTGNVVIKLMQNARQISSIVKSVSELSQIEFDIPVEQYGAYQIIVDGDDVIFDNSFHFVISERSKPRIVVFDEDNNEYIRTAFSKSDLFDLANLNVNSLEFNSLSNADIIVINFVDEIPLGLINQNPNVNYIVFPAPNLNTDSYEKLLDLRLNKADESSLEITLDENQPLLRGIFSNSFEETILPEAQIAFNVISGNFDAIFNYRSGDPFLLKSKNVYFFNTELTTSNGFQSKALFLPLLYQIAFRESNNIEVPYYYPGDKFVVSNINVSDNPVKILNQSYEFIPAFNSSGNDLIIEIPSDAKPGKYFLIHNNDTINQIAINIPKEESVMTSLSKDEIEEFFIDNENVIVTRIDQTQNVLLAENTEVSFWKYALFLVLLLVMSETMLHRYFR
ncbi:BatA domain-containing protein [Ekhidna sp.]|uniref:BatA domain-containing protein n=1 Tax=Ekhidna sp. TaxID=2608089 RepID=UPI003B5098E4